MKWLNYKNYGRLWTVYGRSLLRCGTPRKIINLLRTELAYRRRAPVVRSYPFILFLEPLYYCNLECPLCDRQTFPDARPGKEAGRLSLELFDRILAEAGDYLLQCQIFGQGEPLLDWPRTRAIVERCRARRIFTLMSTNCILLSPDIAADIVRSRLDHVVCAIDGITQQSYEKYRTPGRFDQAYAGMAALAKACRDARAKHLRVEWQFLVNKFNQHEIPQAQRLARDLGVAIRFSPLRGMEFDPDLQSAWLAADAADFAAGAVPDGQTVYPWPCYFLWRSLVLNSNGKAARCLIYQNVAEYASLHDVSLHEAFNHPTVQRARLLFSKRPVPPGEFPAPCNHCSFYARHHGGENRDKWGALHRPKLPAATFMPAGSLTVSARRP